MNVLFLIVLLAPKATGLRLSKLKAFMFHTKNWRNHL